MKLVGIVAQGTQRKVLMMDRGNLGHIIRRGDCVGKERAFVKDIGPGFVTFVIGPSDDDKTPTAQPTEQNIQLNPTGLEIAPQPSDAEPTSTAPVVSPTRSTPTRGTATGSGTTAPVVSP